MTREPDPYVSKGAIISPCGTYRYCLWREWRGHGARETWNWVEYDDGSGREFGQPKSCVFIMLNPSTADGEQDDPTIRRCVGFAKAFGYDRLEVVNLFAYRTSSPAELLRMHGSVNIEGPDNSGYVESATGDAGMVICAWGAHGSHIGQDETVFGWMQGPEPMALALTKDGQPRHPLYLKADCRPFPFTGRRRAAS